MRVKHKSVTAKAKASLGIVIGSLGASLFLISSIILQPHQIKAVEYQTCESGDICTVGEFLYADDYTPETGASCTITSRYPDDSIFLNNASMTESTEGDAWYYYDIATSGEPEGVYRTTVCCTPAGGENMCLDKTFEIVSPTLTPGSIASAVWSYSTRTLTSFGTLVADIWNNTTRSLTTREITSGENIAQEETLQGQWTTRFSGDGEILAGETYRCKLWVLDYQTELTDAVSTPTYTIYDAQRNTVVTGASMTKVSTGVYECTYNVPGSATGGRWETVVDVDIGGSSPIQDGSYWEVESSPAQVKINSITDNTIPTISANVTITNEGQSDFEYQYAYCVVDQENNACGGGDDTFYSSGAKFIQVGEDWTTDLEADVPSTGQYWFKLIVYWGTEKSAATQVFTAGEGEVCLGDFNSDGWVDLTDFSILLFWWNQNNEAHDLSGDGFVNLTDFSIMLFYWGKCP